MPPHSLPQPVSRRQLYTNRSQTTTNLDVRTSAAHRPCKRSFSQPDSGSDQDVDIFRGRLLGVEDALMLAALARRQERNREQAHCESDKGLDRFKGRLLGVEDGLIDAIVRASFTGYSTRQGALESSNKFLWYSQAKIGISERQLLPSAKRPSDARASPTDRCPQASAGSPTLHASVSLPSNPYPDLKNHKQCNIWDDYTAAHHTYHPCAVDYHCDSIFSDNGESAEQCSELVWDPIESGLATTVYSTPSIPSVLATSPSTSDSDVPGVTETWDLSIWQTLESTTSDLLVMGE